MSDSEQAREYICICKKVSLSFIEENFRKVSSKKILQEIIEMTKATKGCGACVIELKNIVEECLQNYPEVLLQIKNPDKQNFLFE